MTLPPSLGKCINRLFTMTALSLCVPSLGTGMLTGITDPFYRRRSRGQGGWGDPRLSTTEGRKGKEPQPSTDSETMLLAHSRRAGGFASGLASSVSSRFCLHPLGAQSIHRNLSNQHAQQSPTTHACVSRQLTVQGQWVFTVASLTGASRPLHQLRTV